MGIPQQDVVSVGFGLEQSDRIVGEVRELLQRVGDLCEKTSFVVLETGRRTGRIGQGRELFAPSAAGPATSGCIGELREFSQGVRPRFRLPPVVIGEISWILPRIRDRFPVSVPVLVELRRFQVR